MTEIILRSLYVSGSALVIASLVGLPLGTALALGRFPLRRTTATVVYAGLALPPVVVGLAVYLLLSRSGPLGALELIYSPPAMILAQALIATPYVAAITMAAVEGVGPDVRLQARALGATPMQALLLHLREVRGSLIAALAAGFGAVISEVGAVMMVGGNVLGETRVMTTAIVLETRRGNFALAIGLGGVLLAIALTVNAVLLALSRQSERRLFPS